MDLVTQNLVTTFQEEESLQDRNRGQTTIIPRTPAQAVKKLNNGLTLSSKASARNGRCAGLRVHRQRAPP